MSFAPSSPSLVQATQDRLTQAFAQARREDEPYAHWFMSGMLIPQACAELIAWDPGLKAVAHDVGGRRETRNESRVFVTPSKRETSPALGALADVFQAQATREMIAQVCGSRLEDTWLRMELALDTEGFWLEPHTDVGAKRLTLLVSLSTHEDASQWGTDIMTPDGVSVARSSGALNEAVMFVPSANTYHGFERRPIRGLRRTLIINYVDQSWRSRHELAFTP